MQSLAGTLLLCLALPFSLPAQAHPRSLDPGISREQSAALAVPPESWAADTARNEIEIIEHQGSYLRYRIHVIDDKGDQVRDTIESRDGTVARAIMKDGHALTAEADQAERERLADMLASPTAFARHVKSEAAGRKNGIEMVRLLPEAMLYSFAPGQPQTGTNHGNLEIVLDFKPNPAFDPPNMQSQALTGLMGRVWVDARSRRMVRMQGEVFQSVNFGWGMLAHVYPGGKWIIDQTEVGGQRWIFTHFSDEVSVRALMVKTKNVHTDVRASDFQTIEPVSYQQAIRMLLDTQLPK